MPACRDLWRLECEHLRCQATPKDPIVLGGVVLTMLAVGLVARLQTSLGSPPPQLPCVAGFSTRFQGPNMLVAPRRESPHLSHLLLRRGR